MLGIGVFLLVLFLRACVVVAPYYKIAILSGDRSLDDSERIVGYRLIRDSWGMRKPSSERVDFLYLGPYRFSWTPEELYCQGTVPVCLEVKGEVHIDHREPVIHEAIERFFDTPGEHIVQMVKDILIADLRELLVCHSFETFETFPVRLRHQWIEKSREDLKKMGLFLHQVEITRYEQSNQEQSPEHLEAVGSEEHDSSELGDIRPDGEV